MRTHPTALLSLAAILFLPVSATAQTSPTSPWPPPSSYPTPAAAPAYPAPAPVYPSPAPAYPAPAPAPAPTPTPPTAAPAPGPSYWAPAPSPAPAPAPVAAPEPAPAPAPIRAPAPAPVAAPAPAPEAAPPVVTSEPTRRPASETEESKATTAPAVASETDERSRGFVPQLSLGGSVGLLHMASGDVGTVGQFRLSLHGEYFTGSNFLVQSDADPSTGTPAASDRNTRLQGALTFGITPVDHLELFGAVLGSANRNRRLCYDDASTGQEKCVSEANRTDPELIKSFGDLVFGVKASYPVAPGFVAGGEVGIRLMSSITGISFSGDSTSLVLSACEVMMLRLSSKYEIRSRHCHDRLAGW